MKKKIGILMNGVTGRMGTNQHLIRSIAAIRNEGGVRLRNGSIMMPEPILIGRSRSKLEELSERAGGVAWSTDLDSALATHDAEIYFDAQVTEKRGEGVRKAIAAGKHIYCEKPTSGSLAEAMELFRLAEAAGVKHGVVQDKLFLPGLIKLNRLIRTGALGRVLSVRGEFGYWVFTGGPAEEGGDDALPQRPSWNYRAEDGGGIIIDMLCHWRYVLDNIFGEVKAVSCLGASHVPRRWDESGQPYDCTADDSAYATFELEGGVIAHFNSSWCVRVRRDDLLTLQVDGTQGSAVAGLRDCWFQPASATPRPVWNPDVPSPISFQDGWTKIPDNASMENAFKVQWEKFLCHVAGEGDFPWSLKEGAKGVQLAEAGLQSWKERRWISLPPLE